MVQIKTALNHPSLTDIKSDIHNQLLILTEKPSKMQQCIKILLFLILNDAQHISGDTPPIIRSLKLHKQPLVLHTWKVVLCSFRLLMMGGVSPETCSASFKIRNNKILIHCYIWLGFSVRIVLQCTDPRTSNSQSTFWEYMYCWTTMVIH